MRHQGLGTPAEETKHTRSVRYQLMRPGRPRPQACRSGSSGPAQLQEGGAQNRTAICARPRTGTCPIPAVSRCWPGQAGRPARSWASPLRSLHIRPISTIRPRIEPSDALSVAPCGAGGGRGRIGGAEQFSADCPTASADASSFRRDLGVVLLMSSVTVLALAVKALWLTRCYGQRYLRTSRQRYMRIQRQRSVRISTKVRPQSGRAGREALETGPGPRCGAISRSRYGWWSPTSIRVGAGRSSVLEICQVGPAQGGNARRRAAVLPIPMTSQRRFTRVASRALPQMMLAKRQGPTMALPARAQRRRAASQAAPRLTTATRGGGPIGPSSSRGNSPS